MTLIGFGGTVRAVAVGAGDATVVGVSAIVGTDGTFVGVKVGSNVNPIVGMTVAVGVSGVGGTDVAVEFGEELLHAAPKIATTTRIQETALNFRALTPSPLVSSVSG